MITAHVVGRSMIPPWFFSETTRMTPDDTMFHDAGEGVWMADPELSTETVPGRSCMMAMEVTTTEATTISLQIQTDTGPLRKMVHPLFGAEADCGLILLMQVVDRGPDEEMLFMGMWGGYCEWKEVTIPLPPGSARVVAVAMDFPARAFDPGLPWPEAPEGHTPTNLIHIRRMSVNPLPYGSPGFGVRTGPVGPERSRVGPAEFSIWGHDGGTAQGRIHRISSCPVSLLSPEASSRTKTDVAFLRKVIKPWAWRNPYPPGVAVPALPVGEPWEEALHGMGVRLEPTLQRPIPSVAEFLLPAGGDLLLFRIRVQIGSGWYPYESFSTLHRILIEQEVGGMLIPLWNMEATSPEGLKDFPATVGEYTVPAHREGSGRVRISVYPNAVLAGHGGWPSNVRFGGLELSYADERPLPHMGLISPRLSASWGIVPAEAATAQVIYTCTLSGTEAGLPDLDLPMTSFACRLRTATPSYLSVTVPSRPGLSADIAARRSGTLRVCKGYRLVSGYERSEEIARGKYDRMSSAGGGRSSSLTLVGYHRYGEGAGTLRPLQEVMVDGNDMEGRRTVRAAVDMWMRPGDVATWEGQTMTVGAVAIHVSVERATMDLTEA
ncbi:hypothetical protein OOT00_15845 [Desulfobotulus sp. H1]|uniref:Uncharacterized protein n=1 Tax=Desulfobotulus pelophilus TaxID=2823377 RepID=A0ABT3NDA9_9BACT|nr:hypothetical protein [Desulfobotulus pelophilus]MCW7755449.1 hypothetical protein [Desulfobotulus pelophilus]